MIKALLAAVLFLQFASVPNSASSTRVIVLGIAQDGGIPQIGCKQEICLSQRHSVSSLAILHDNSLYLVDASPDLREQFRELINRQKVEFKKNLFDGIFLTHAHMGHYTGLLYLGKESISTQRTPVFCSEEMASYLTGNAPWNLLTQNGNIEIKTFSSGKALDMGFQITPFAVPHRKEFTDTHGFLIRGQKKSLLYIPDIDAWEPSKESLMQWLKESDYALLDGTFYSGKELPGRDMTKIPHPTIEHSIAFFGALPELKSQIIFTHLNHTNPVLIPDSMEAQSVKNAGFRVAVDWQEFTL